MVVNDAVVAIGSLAPHFGDEATLEFGALAANAMLGAGIQLSPERRVLRQGSEFGAVAGAGLFVPVQQNAELIDLIQAVENGLAGKVVELFAAKIVLPSLHVANLEPRFACTGLPEESMLEERHILEEELLLQVLGSGGDDDAL